MIDVSLYYWVAVIAEGVEAKHPLDSHLASLIYIKKKKIRFYHLRLTSRVSYHNEVDCTRIAYVVRDAVSMGKPRRCRWLQLT